jgi:hypothetical protein
MDMQPPRAKTNTMAFKIRLKEEQTRALQKISELGPAKLDSVHSALRSTDKSLLSTKQLKEFVANTIDRPDAEVLSNHLVSLCSLMIRMDQEAQGIVEAIDEHLSELHAAEKFSNLAEWRSISESFLRLLESPEIRRVAMALSLNYDYANLLHRAKILTDIRPIFSKTAENIEACVVSYTMRLHYSTGDGQRELSIALDHNDVESLLSQCERALTKSKTAKASMVNAGFHTEISGDDKEEGTN